MKEGKQKTLPLKMRGFPISAMVDVALNTK